MKTSGGNMRAAAWRRRRYRYRAAVGNLYFMHECTVMALSFVLSFLFLSFALVFFLLLLSLLLLDLVGKTQAQAVGYHVIRTTFPPTSTGYTAGGVELLERW